MLQKFSKKEAIIFGWEITKNNFFFFIPFILILEILYILPNFLINLFKKDYFSFLTLLGLLIPVLILILIAKIGFIRISLKFYNNEKPKFNDFFKSYNLFFKFLIGWVLYSLIIFGILIFLIILFYFFAQIIFLAYVLMGFIIILGIILLIRFYFFDYFIVEKELAPLEAFKNSWKITKESLLNLFLFFFLVIIINFISAFVFLIGLFIAIPLTNLSKVYVYKKLSSQI
jgi:hypothetical protein